MQSVYFDIETRVAKYTLPVDPSKFKPTKTAQKKGPAAVFEEIDGKVREAQRKEWEGSSLEPLRGSICCVSIQPHGGDIETCVGEEFEVLTWLEAKLIENGALVELVGFNIIEFDLVWLQLRAMHHKMYPLVRLIRRCAKRDLRKMYAMGRWTGSLSGKMRDIAKFLGWEGDDDISGSRVSQCWAMGDLETIELHASVDVEATAFIGDVFAQCGMWTPGEQ